MAPARTEKKSFVGASHVEASSAPVTSRHVVSRDPASATSTKKHAVDSTTSNDNDASTETQIPVVDPVTLHLKREAVVVGSIDDHLRSLGPSWCAESSIHQKNKIDADGFASKNPERHMLARRRAFLEKFSDPAAHQPYALRRAIQRANDKVKQLAEEAAAIDNPRAAKENQRGIDGRGTREKRSAQLRLPEDPKLYEEWYLVTGRNVGKPGAYPSWRSAQATAEPTATPQMYTSWEALESAWYHECDRGEHKHPTRNSPLCPTSCSVFTTCTPPLRPLWPLSPSLPSGSRFGPAPLTTPHCSSRSRTPPTPRSSPRVSPVTHSSTRPATRAKMVYAVRGNGQGVVFDSYEQARALYLQLQAQGFSAALSCSPSLTDGVCWIEGFLIGAPSKEAARRRAWIGEERAASQYLLETSVDSDDDSWWSDNSGVDDKDS
ncbi:hypothetical protein DFH06DRAFT_1351028 [Mycena polygramma]|nr:hypothetical protein DFH06DRAFT_1351028 [Mycena polygramma]